MLTTQPVKYVLVSNTTATIKPTVAGSDVRGELYGFICLTNTTVTAYNNTAASGSVIYPATALTAGQVVHFGGPGILFNIGLTIVSSGGNVNVLYV